MRAINCKQAPDAFVATSYRHIRCHMLPHRTCRKGTNGLIQEPMGRMSATNLRSLLSRLACTMNETGKRLRVIWHVLCYLAGVVVIRSLLSVSMTYS